MLQYKHLSLFFLISFVVYCINDFFNATLNTKNLLKITYHVIVSHTTSITCDHIYFCADPFFTTHVLNFFTCVLNTVGIMLLFFVIPHGAHAFISDFVMSIDPYFSHLLSSWGIPACPIMFFPYIVLVRMYPTAVFESTFYDE